MIKWGITTPSGTVVRLDDQPIIELQRIAVDGGLESWFDMVRQPLRFGGAAVGLYRYCCQVAGDEPPPAETLTAATLIPAVTIVEDDLPDTFVDGVPKAEADPTTD